MSLKQYVDAANAKAVFGETLFDVRTLDQTVATEMFVRMNAEHRYDMPLSEFRMVSDAWNELAAMGYKTP